MDKITMYRKTENVSEVVQNLLLKWVFYNKFDFFKITNSISSKLKKPITHIGKKLRYNLHSLLINILSEPENSDGAFYKKLQCGE